MTVETHLFINWCDYAVISATERTKLKGILSRSPPTQVGAQGLVIMKKGTGRGNLPEIELSKEC